VFERGSRREGKARYASTLAHPGERFAAEAASFGPMKLCRFLISGELAAAGSERQAGDLAVRSRRGNYKDKGGLAN